MSGRREGGGVGGSSSWVPDENTIMSISNQAQTQLSNQSGILARRCLRACDYRDDLVRDDIQLPGHRNGLVAFAHRPFDTRSSCIAVLPSCQSPADLITACRDIGASLFFITGEKSWDAWAQTSTQPRLLHSVKSSEVENYFRQHREEFAPGIIFRAKTWLRAGVGRQLDFVTQGCSRCWSAKPV